MKWFKEKEFVCRCCGELPPFARENIEALVENVLDPLRERYGKPIIVNSGYRCAKHNREVGGASGSQHMRGEAADIRPSTGSTGSPTGSGTDETNFSRSDSLRAVALGMAMALWPAESMDQQSEQPSVTKRGSSGRRSLRIGKL
jgi:hypothetical protein